MGVQAAGPSRDMPENLKVFSCGGRALFPSQKLELPPLHYGERPRRGRPRGVEQSQDSTGKTSFSKTDDAESDARRQKGILATAPPELKPSSSNGRTAPLAGALARCKCRNGQQSPAPVMTSLRQRATTDDLLAALDSVTDQIKVLVSAVDDLRCEIEWQARNGAIAEPPTGSALPETDDGSSEVGESPTPSAPPQMPDDSLLSAAGRLRAFERACSQGPRTSWSDKWATGDDFEIPAGRLVSVGTDLWSAVLDIRPAHVIGEGCYCEKGIGEPFLLAWRSGDEFMLRELNDGEALKLQELCLANQAEEAAPQESQVRRATGEAQLGLF
jgi:hypothetical protein